MAWWRAFLEGLLDKAWGAFSDPLPFNHPEDCQKGNAWGCAGWQTLLAAMLGLMLGHEMCCMLHYQHVQLTRRRTANSWQSTVHRAAWLHMPSSLLYTVQALPCSDRLITGWYSFCCSSSQPSFSHHFLSNSFMLTACCEDNAFTNSLESITVLIFFFLIVSFLFFHLIHNDCLQWGRRLQEQRR